MFLLRSVGNGECLGDSVWASIWCGTEHDVGCVHAEIMGHLVRHCPYFVTSLYLVTSHLEALWTDGWDLRCCWSVLCITSYHSKLITLGDKNTTPSFHINKRVKLFYSDKTIIDENDNFIKLTLYYYYFIYKFYYSSLIYKKSEWKI